MKFSEFLKELFSDKSTERRPLFKGRPPNVHHSGRVMRAPAIVVSPHYRQHVTREGKKCTQRVKGNKREPLPTMLHRGIAREVFKARVNALKRKAMKRYVW